MLTVSSHQAALCARHHKVQGGNKTSAKFCANFVLQVASTVFYLHLQPHTKDDRQPGAKRVSPAGQGPGLQVLPGSAPDVDCVSCKSCFGSDDAVQTAATADTVAGLLGSNACCTQMLTRYIRLLMYSIGCTRGWKGQNHLSSCCPPQNLYVLTAVAGCRNAKKWV